MNAKSKFKKLRAEKKAVEKRIYDVLIIACNWRSDYNTRDWRNATSAEFLSPYPEKERVHVKCPTSEIINEYKEKGYYFRII